VNKILKFRDLVDGEAIKKHSKQKHPRKILLLLSPLLSSREEKNFHPQKLQSKNNYNTDPVLYVDILHEGLPDGLFSNQKYQIKEGL
jgi:hypothetical protein